MSAKATDAKGEEGENFKSEISKKEPTEGIRGLWREGIGGKGSVGFLGDELAEAFVDGEGDIGWGPIVGDQREYLQSAPRNAWVGGGNAKVLRIEPGATADSAFQLDYGWKFNPDNWEVYAGGFDDRDNPFPRN